MGVINQKWKRADKKEGEGQNVPKMRRYPL